MTARIAQRVDPGPVAYMNPMIVSSVFLIVAAVVCAYVALQPLWQRSRMDRLIGAQRAGKRKKRPMDSGLFALAGSSQGEAGLSNDLQAELIAEIDRLPGRSSTINSLFVAAACVAFASLGAIVFRLPMSIILAFVIASAVLPISVVHVFRRQKVRRLESQMPRAFDGLANSLRTGRSLATALEDAMLTCDDPLRSELGRLHDALELGEPLSDALDQFEQRVSGDQAGFLVAALKMQAKLGGDVSKSIDIVSSVVRARLELQGQVKSLSAEARVSGIVLFALPIAAFVGIYFAAPDYVSLLWTDQLGRKLVAAALVMQVLGGLCIQQILSGDW